jgi:hypothetical protein
MLTFVNGFAAAAGGNFVEALGITKITDVSPVGGALSFAASTGALLLGLFMFIIITVIIAVMVVALVVRMVTLWMLVVISPAAFALGASDLTKEHYAKWWKMFSSELTAGPIVAFFLWLSLITFQSSSGSGIVGTPLNVDSSGKEAAQISCGDFNACSQENLIRFIVAAVMLISGLTFAKEFSGLGGQLAKSAKEKGGKYFSNAVNWSARKSALPVAAVATGGVGMAAYGAYLGAGTQRGGSFIGKNLAKMPGFRGVGLKMQANVSKERLDEVKKAEDLRKFADWEDMKNETYSVRNGKVTESAFVPREVAQANYKLLMKNKNWQRKASNEEKLFVMERASALAKETKDEGLGENIKELEKTNPNLIPKTKKASDPIFANRFEEIMKTIGSGDALKMDPAAFTPEVIAKLPTSAIEKVIKDGNDAQKSELEKTLKRFADRTDAGISPEDHDKYYKDIENNERDLDTLTKSELSNPAVLAKIMDKPVKDREDLFKKDDIKVVIGKTATDELVNRRSKPNFVYGDEEKRLAEAAAVASSDAIAVYNFDKVKKKFSDNKDRVAFGQALAGKSKAEIVFAVDVDQIKYDTQIGQDLAQEMNVSDIVDLAKKAENNAEKAKIVRKIIMTIRDLEQKETNVDKKKELTKKIAKIEKSQITNQYA